MEQSGESSLPIPSNLGDAKAYLLQSNDNGNSLYEHLSEVILKLLEHRPQNALDHFEEISFEVKSAKLHAKNQIPKEGKDVDENTLDENLAGLRTNLFKNFELTSGSYHPVLPNEGDMPDLLEEAQYFEWAGIGFGREETFRIMLSMKQLLENNPLKSVRFFGKIFGRQKDYLIVESEYKEGGRPDDLLEEVTEEKMPDDSDSEVEESATKSDKPKIAEIDSEIGTGTNRYTYWVSTSPGEPWVRLPNVTPAQITGARRIKKFLTGELTAKISSYPSFPGTEANYLRAQISRIASATVICPKGFYSVDEEEDSFEVPLLQINQDFEGLDPADLLKTSNWVHCHPHILNQGRCTFFSAKKEKDEEEEDDEIEEQIEEGPKLLHEVQDDAAVDKFDAWTISLSSTSNQKYGHVIAKSNRWPGAYAYARDDRFANIYVGYGIKYTTESFSPPLPGAMQQQLPTPQEALEPTVEEEEAYEKSQVKEVREESAEGEEDEEASEEETEDD